LGEILGKWSFGESKEQREGQGEDREAQSVENLGKFNDQRDQRDDADKGPQ
jgi:hypothetical protein